MENLNLYVVVSSPLFVATMPEEDTKFFYSQIRKMPGVCKSYPKKRSYTSAYEGLVVSCGTDRFSIFRDVVKAESEDKIDRLLIDHRRNLERYLIDKFVKNAHTKSNSQITPYQYNTLILQDLSQVFSYTDAIRSDFDMRS